MLNATQIIQEWLALKESSDPDTIEVYHRTGSGANAQAQFAYLIDDLNKIRSSVKNSKEGSVIIPVHKVKIGTIEYQSKATRGKIVKTTKDNFIPIQASFKKVTVDIDDETLNMFNKEEDEYPEISFSLQGSAIFH